MINTDVKTNYKPDVVGKNAFLDVIDEKIHNARNTGTFLKIDNFEVKWSAMKHFLTQDVVMRENIPVQDQHKWLGGKIDKKSGWVYRGIPLKIVDDTTIWHRFKYWWLKHWRIN